MSIPLLQGHIQAGLLGAPNKAQKVKATFLMRLWITWELRSNIAAVSRWSRKFEAASWQGGCRRVLPVPADDQKFADPSS